jgi:hypothetical protein
MRERMLWRRCQRVTVVERSTCGEAVEVRGIPLRLRHRVLRVSRDEASLASVSRKKRRGETWLFLTARR